jgi:ribonuclease P protein component
VIYSFPKKFRTFKKNKIDLFFEKKDQFNEFPFLIRYFWEEDDKGTYRILITVSKKKIPLAVKRNIIKRRIREAWRKHAPVLLEKLHQKNLILYINLHFTQTHPLPYHDIEQAIKKVIERLIHTHEKMA